MTTAFSPTPATWDEAASYPEYEAAHKPFGIPVPKDSKVVRFATLQSLLRLSGSDDVKAVDFALEYLGYDLIVKLLLNGFTFEKMADLARNRVSRHNIRDVLSLGSGILSADEVADLAAIQGNFSISYDIVLVLHHYGIVTPERVAKLFANGGIF